MAEITDFAEGIISKSEICDSGASNEDEELFQRIREERQREVDSLSLELLSNTKHYKKYIAKNYPETQLKRIDDSQRFLKYKSRIAALFIEMLDEYENDGDDCSELHTIFKEMVQKTIQHLEWTSYNKIDKSAFSDETSSSSYAHSSLRNCPEYDEDVMFPEPSEFSMRKNHRTVETDPFSFWGATIRKRRGDDYL